MSCFYGCLMSFVGIQKLFCGIYSALKCSFDELVEEKVVSPSYSSANLGLPTRDVFLNLRKESRRNQKVYNKLYNTTS